MPTFLSFASFEPRIITYLVIYLVSLMGMWRYPMQIKHLHDAPILAFYTLK